MHSPRPEDSPILPLESVIGIAVAHQSAVTRPGGGPASKSLKKEAAGASGFPVKRPVASDAVTFYSVEARSDTGGSVAVLLAAPIEGGPFPGVFLLDAEVQQMAFPVAPENADLDEFEGGWLIRNPLGSHLAGAGFAVGFVTQTSLRRATHVPLDAWVALLEKFGKHKRIDPASVFIVATRENARLALLLAGKVKVAGVIVEEPAGLLFAPPPPEPQKGAPRQRPKVELGDPPLPDLASFTPEIAGRYRANLTALQSPLMLIMARSAPYALFNRQTLLAVLTHVKADFRVVMLEKTARTWIPRKARKHGEPEPDPAAATQDEPEPIDPLSDRDSGAKLAFEYDRDALERWMAGMLQFCRSRSKTQPQALPGVNAPSQKMQGPSWGSAMDASLSSEQADTPTQ